MRQIVAVRHDFAPSGAGGRGRLLRRGTMPHELSALCDDQRREKASRPIRQCWLVDYFQPGAESRSGFGPLRLGRERRAHLLHRAGFDLAIRSADTLNSAARSCSVAPPEPSSDTLSQRASMMRRLRSSSEPSAEGQAVRLKVVELTSREHFGRFLARIRQVGDRRIAFPHRRRPGLRARCRRRTAGFPSRRLLHA